MTSRVLFPGGLALIDEKHVKKRLAEFMGDGRQVRAYYDGTRWDIELWVGREHYDAGSELGFWDAVANALQAAQGREQDDPELA